MDRVNAISLEVFTESLIFFSINCFGSGLIALFLLIGSSNEVVVEIRRRRKNVRLFLSYLNITFYKC